MGKRLENRALRLLGEGTAGEQEGSVAGRPELGSTGRRAESDRPATGAEGRQVPKRFISSLFDMTFTSFVTPRVIRVLYMVTLVLIAIAYVVIAVAIFAGGSGTVHMNMDGSTYETGGGGNAGLGVLWLLVLGPLFMLLYTLIYRVLFELITVFFRIYENTRDQLELGREANPEAAARLASQGDAE